MNKLIISITSGVGSGQTQLAAFDAALWDAKIANYNLVKLSSIIPKNSRIKARLQTENASDEFGNRLYVVLSEHRESERGREAWAGLGWVQAKDGRGLFVEQSGSQEIEVKRLLKQTIEDMMKYRKEKFGSINYKIVGIQCKSKSVCALVAAVYKSEDWE